MNVASEPIQRARLLEIRRVQVVSGDGRASTSSSVLCPSRQRTAPLEECMRCERSSGLAEDPAGRATFVSCVAPAAGHHDAVAGERPSVAEATPVSAVMSTQVVAVRPDVSVDSLTALFLERDIGGAPVVDAHGRPIGVVSKTDLLRERYESGDTAESRPLRARSGFGYPTDLGGGFHAEPPARTIGDVMSRVAFTLSENASIAEAAALMAFEGVHRVPVVSDAGRVVGVLTTLDVLRWLAQQDGYLLPAGKTLRAR